MPPLPDHADDLTEMLAAAFRLLQRGVVDRKSPFRTLNLGTVAPDGAPEVRTVVLRGFDAEHREVRFHTDRRSAKVEHMTADPRVALHGYDRGGQVQIRLSGTASLHVEDEVARTAWARSAPGARACYAIDPAPGTPVAAPVPAPVLDGDAFRNFALVRVQFDMLEWLWLSVQGHRRARFIWRDEKLAATWLVQ